MIGTTWYLLNVGPYSVHQPHAQEPFARHDSTMTLPPNRSISAHNLGHGVHSDLYRQVHDRFHFWLESGTPSWTERPSILHVAISLFSCTTANVHVGVQVGGKLKPRTMDEPPVPGALLRVIRGKCKSDSDSKRCTYRRHGRGCLVACGKCRLVVQIH